MNVGKACGTDEGLSSAIGVVSESVSKWTVLFLPEVDGFLDSRPSLSTSHLTFRHWPWEGSFAMQICIRAAAHHLAQDVIWLNRCGAVYSYKKHASKQYSINLYVIVVHNSHGDLQDEVLLDVANLVRRKPLGADISIIGDWNIDQLPVHETDPWADTINRSSHHSVPRLKLMALLDRHGLELNVPATIMSGPGGPFSLQCTTAPITRIPIGVQADSCLPSTLDYAVSSRGVLREGTIFWRGVPADQVYELCCSATHGCETQLEMFR